MRSTAFVKILLAVGLVGFLGACANKPTTTSEQSERRLKAGGVPIKAVELSKATIVIDARSAYQYSLAHIPQSINMQWSDFTQNTTDARGVLQTDLYAGARRLARYGIQPTTHVVVVGEGLKGNADEWRLAWTLQYLGLENVQAVPLDYFKGHLDNNPPPPPVAVPIWKPEPESALLVTREELLSVLNRGGVHKPTTPPKRPEASPRIYKILDVRSPREYLGKEGMGVETLIPNMDAINIEWKEFFDQTGRPDPAIVDKIHGIGITNENRIIVISDDGVRSAAVTLALKELGFVDVGNYAGGLKELIAKAQVLPEKVKKKRKR